MRIPYKNIIIDTSIFVNPDSFSLWGKSPVKALSCFIEKASGKNIGLYTPPSIWQEIACFIKLKSLAPELTSYIIKKPPGKYGLSLPSLFLYEFIEDMRFRINKGLRIAEKYTKKGLEGKNQEEYLIKSLRNEFRAALREGILDSRQDVDIILLAKELAIPLATSDNGLIFWAEKLGIECLILDELKTALFT